MTDPTRPLGDRATNKKTRPTQKDAQECGAAATVTISPIDFRFHHTPKCTLSQERQAFTKASIFGSFTLSPSLQDITCQREGRMRRKSRVLL